MRWKWALRILALSTLGAVIGGCAQEREPINRVQPNALKKSFFLGQNLQDSGDDPEFWSQQMIVDVGFGAAQGGLFTVGYGGKMSRVKFEITENYLIGRITYERIDNTDKKGVNPDKKDGIIAVMYPVLSHFDIRRDYNSSTGEEMNVVVENTSDRPWYDREYVRVDFSKNMNVDSYDFDMLTDIGLIGGIHYEPLAYYVNDPSHPDAPRFSEEDGYFDVTNKAFAAPQLVDLSMMGWGIDAIPACMLPNDFFGGSDPAGNCNPIEMTVRQSFRRVVDRDYEPENWDGYKQASFGAFQTNRLGYETNYGITDNRWRRFISRYNIWERSHYYDDPVNMTGAIACDGGADMDKDDSLVDDKDPTLERAWKDQDPKNGTDDRCEEVTNRTGVAGSRCDKYKGKCTLPYRLRKPVVTTWYYTNNEAADEYFEPTEWGVNEWDVALRSAVMAARFAECKATGGQNCAAEFPVLRGQQTDNEDAVLLAREVDACRWTNGHRDEGCVEKADEKAAAIGIAGDPDRAGVIALAKMPEMLTLCHSPVRDIDHPACGKPGLVARLGDLRYNGVNVHMIPQTPSPWGIMVDSDDPLTGEKVMTSVNAWAYVNDLWSQGAVDLMRYVRGELKTEEITDGKYVRDWVGAVKSSTSGTGGVLPGMTSDQVMGHIAAAAGTDVKSARKAFEQVKAGHIPPMARALRSRVSRIQASMDATPTNKAVVEARKLQARGTEFEGKLATKAMIQRAGLNGASMTSDVMNHVSPLRMNNPSWEAEFRRLRERAFANRGMCVLAEAPEGTGLPAMANRLWEKFGGGSGPEAAEKVRRYLRRHAHYAVIAHEMGHSVGLRHNFVSSYDALGFRPQYWQLRTNDGKIHAGHEKDNYDLCTELSSDGACVGPRYYDPITATERDGVITQYMQSSVMDYAGTVEGDLIGLGVWDFAATRMFYGGTAAVFTAPEFKEGVSAPVLGSTGNPDESTFYPSYYLLSKMDNFGGITGMSPTLGVMRPDGTGTPKLSDADLHYSALQKYYGLIKDCKPVNAEAFRPSDWREDVDGKWLADIDGHVVKPDGTTATRCKEQQVEPVLWATLKMPNNDAKTGPVARGEYYRGGPSVDPEGRIRVPYGFGSDEWADLGNLSVYRHDLGADPYELFLFFINQQETRHIIDNYRRNRSSFSVRSASERAFERYNAKMRDGAKGLGLYLNIYEDMMAKVGYNPAEYKAFVLSWFPENTLAAGMAFDHFARQLARPQEGPHFSDLTTDLAGMADNTLGSQFEQVPVAKESTDDDVLVTADRLTAKELLAGPNDVARYRQDLTSYKIDIPNGATGSSPTTGFFNEVGIGGRPLQNGLAENKGDYDRDYTLNCGSYYDKIFAPMLMTESVDNFISSERNDFLDPRQRSVSLADVFPEGFRRLIANSLTNDNWLTGPRIVATDTGAPEAIPADPATPTAPVYPTRPLGWTSWWPKDGPQVCFPTGGTTICSSPAKMAMRTSDFDCINGECKCLWNNQGSVCCDPRIASCVNDANRCDKLCATPYFASDSAADGKCTGASADCTCRKGAHRGETCCVNGADANTNACCPDGQAGIQAATGACCDPHGTDEMCISQNLLISPPVLICEDNCTDSPAFECTGPNNAQTCTCLRDINRGAECCNPATAACAGDAKRCDNYCDNPLWPLPFKTRVVDPEIGWEQQKFIIAQTLLYLPENQKQQWLDMMRIYEIGVEDDPGFDQRIEFHNPISGKTYVAKTYGTETIFGRTGIQKGIAARMLQYANVLSSLAFKPAPAAEQGPDLNKDGKPDWFIAAKNADGTPIILDDLNRRAVSSCDESPHCVMTQNYTEVLFFMRQAISSYGLTNLQKKGIFE